MEAVFRGGMSAMRIWVCRRIPYIFDDVVDGGRGWCCELVSVPEAENAKVRTKRAPSVLGGRYLDESALRSSQLPARLLPQHHEQIPVRGLFELWCQRAWCLQAQCTSASPQPAVPSTAHLPRCA
jgi:hypothetical protein